MEEPHRVRRRQILARYPEIRKLMGHDNRNAFFASLTVATQLVVAYFMRDVSFPYLFLYTYILSGTLNHSLFLAMHEVSHDLMFKSRTANLIFSHIINLPTGVPASPYFQVYHKAHHTDLGDPREDTDIPSKFESAVFRGKCGRFCWLSLQSLCYIIRPMLVKPLPISIRVVVGSIIQYTFDLCIVHFFGWRPLFYLLVGSILGGSLHPMSGHFIAEHFGVTRGQATYSYYGPLNRIAYNVGYHIEHHDFPNIPCSKLPLLRRIAPEWYDLPSHESWTRVMFDFVMNPSNSFSCRYTRPSRDDRR